MGEKDAEYLPDPLTLARGAMLAACTWIEAGGEPMVAVVDLRRTLEDIEVTLAIGEHA